MCLWLAGKEAEKCRYFTGMIAGTKQKFLLQVRTFVLYRILQICKVKSSMPLTEMAFLPQYIHTLAIAFVATLRKFLRTITNIVGTLETITHTKQIFLLFY